MNQNKWFFNYQFGFWNYHSKKHTLVSITAKVRKSLDEGKCACGVFLNLQKAFDTVNHKILICKLEHYGIRGLPLHLFQNYLEKRTQFVEINKKSSNVVPINHDVLQGSVLGPLLFLIYINDLIGVVNFSKIHHFAGDTNMLYTSNSLKDINRKINRYLKSIAERLKATKISLNSGKTELVLFRSKDKKITKNMHFKIKEHKINLISEVKYLGLILDENLRFKYHLQNLKLKLSRANCLLSKIRYYVKFALLQRNYYALFDSRLRNVNTTIYRSHSITLKAIKQWNKPQNVFKTILFPRKWHIPNIPKIYKNLHWKSVE